jgi:hypothetical protein
LTIAVDGLAFDDARAARRSSMRPLVQEPMKTRSSLMSVIFCRLQAHVFERALLESGAWLVGDLVGIGTGR